MLAYYPVFTTALPQRLLSLFCYYHLLFHAGFSALSLSFLAFAVMPARAHALRLTRKEEETAVRRTWQTPGIKLLGTGV